MATWLCIGLRQHSAMLFTVQRQQTVLALVGSSGNPAHPPSRHRLLYASSPVPAALSPNRVGQGGSHLRHHKIERPR